jgi:dolichol-phosphate mannosyltransferase
MSSAIGLRSSASCNGFKSREPLSVSPQQLHARRFIKFCLVGGSGLVVDMIFLFLFSDPRCLGLGVVLSKILSAEVAMINNFIWNELWTFRQTAGTGAKREGVNSSRKDRVRRFIVFNTICGIGMGLAVFLLHMFHVRLGWNLYLANFLAIVLVTFWNFTLNAQFNWKGKKLLAKDTDKKAGPTKKRPPVLRSHHEPIPQAVESLNLL